MKEERVEERGLEGGNGVEGSGAGEATGSEAAQSLNARREELAKSMTELQVKQDGLRSSIDEITDSRHELRKQFPHVPWDKMRGHLQALTKNKAQNTVTATYTKLQAIAEVVPDNYDDDDTEKNVFKVDNRVKNLYARELLETTLIPRAKLRR